MKSRIRLTVLSLLEVAIMMAGIKAGAEGHVIAGAILGCAALMLTYLDGRCGWSV